MEIPQEIRNFWQNVQAYCYLRNLLTWNRSLQEQKEQNLARLEELKRKKDELDFLRSGRSLSTVWIQLVKSFLTQA